MAVPKLLKNRRYDLHHREVVWTGWTSGAQKGDLRVGLRALRPPDPHLDPWVSL